MGVVVIRAVPFGGHTWAPDFWKLSYPPKCSAYTVGTCHGHTSNSEDLKGGWRGIPGIPARRRAPKDLPATWPRLNTLFVHVVPSTAIPEHSFGRF